MSSDHVCATDPNLRRQPSQRLDALLATLRGLLTEIDLIADDYSSSRAEACAEIARHIDAAITEAEQTFSVDAGPRPEARPQLLGSIEALRKKIAADPDDEPTAGGTSIVDGVKIADDYCSLCTALCSQHHAEIDLLRSLVKRSVAVIREVAPERWLDADTMEHMPGIKAARAFIAEVEGDHS